MSNSRELLLINGQPDFIVPQGGIDAAQVMERMKAHSELFALDVRDWLERPPEHRKINMAFDRFWVDKE